jgi:carboxyl-terminal processing protease
MRAHWLRPALLLALGVAGGPVAGAQSAAARLDQPLDGEVAERIVRDIDGTVRKHFAHWESLAGYNYDSAFVAFRAAALAAPDRRRFSLLCEAFVAQLNNGHTQFNDPALYAADPGNLGFSLRHVEGEWVVVASRRPALVPGSIVTAIDGETFESFYARVRGQLNASNERTRRSVLSGYASLFPVAFVLDVKGAAAITIDRARPLPARRDSTPAVERIWLVPDSLLYLRLRSFADRRSESEAVDALQEALASAVPLIIDVRGNGGGSTPSRLGRALLGAEWRSWRTAPPTAAVPASRRARPSAPRFYLLVDRGCGSACEDFAMPFSLSEQALVLGETTGGSSGQPRIVRWNTGMSLWVGARRQWFPDGREFEGVGVSPDVSVPVMAADYRAGAPDRVLACARTMVATRRTDTCER